MDIRVRVHPILHVHVPCVRFVAVDVAGVAGVYEYLTSIPIGHLNDLGGGDWSQLLIAQVINLDERWVLIVGEEIELVALSHDAVEHLGLARISGVGRVVEGETRRGGHGLTGAVEVGHLVLTYVQLPPLQAGIADAIDLVIDLVTLDAHRCLR